MKTCSSCKTAKPLDQFHRESRSADGRQRICKPCTLVHNRRWDTENPGARSALQRAWYASHPEVREKHRRYARNRIPLVREQLALKRAEDPKGVWATQAAGNAKGRATRGGLAYDIDAQYLRGLTGDACPVLDIALVYPRGAGPHKHSDASATVDRLIPALGYVRGNVAVISYRANRMKSDGTAAEMFAIAAWIDANLRPRRIA